MLLTYLPTAGSRKHLDVFPDPTNLDVEVPLSLFHFKVHSSSDKYTNRLNPDKGLSSPLKLATVDELGLSSHPLLVYSVVKPQYQEPAMLLPVDICSYWRMLLLTLPLVIKGMRLILDPIL